MPISAIIFEWMLIYAQQCIYNVSDHSGFLNVILLASTSILFKKKSFLSFGEIYLMMNILNICSNIFWLVFYLGIEFWDSSV